MAELQQLVDDLESSSRFASRYPSHPNKKCCDFYMRTGRCSYGNLCKYDHPLLTKKRPSTSSLENMVYDVERIILITRTSVEVDPRALYRAMASALKVLSEIIFKFDYLDNHAISELILHSLPCLRSTTKKFHREHADEIRRTIDTITESWQAQEHRIFDITSSSPKRRISDRFFEEFGSRVAEICADQDAEMVPQDTHKSQITKSLLEQIKVIWPDRKSDLKPFGSSANRLGFVGSDLDVVLLLQGVKDTIEPMSVHDSLTPVETLLTTDEIFDTLTAECLAIGFSLVEKVSGARVPVLKLHHDTTGVDVDVCVNNQLALENTRLLRRYADIDPRVRPLLFIIKRWAKQRGCNDPKNSTITSYAWVLLALHYLQSACRPPVVPDLADPGSAAVAEAWPSSNTASVGELLYGFFVYYGSGCESSFDLFNEVATIRTVPGDKNVPLTKACSIYALRGDAAMATELARIRESRPVAQAADVHWRLCIEDPFEVHDLGKVVRERVGQAHISAELRRAALVFARRLNPGLMGMGVGVGGSGAISSELLADSVFRVSKSDKFVGFEEEFEGLKVASREREDGDDVDREVAALQPQPQILAALADQILEELLQRNQHVPQLPLVCNRCGLLGHFRRNCPRNRSMSSNGDKRRGGAIAAKADSPVSGKSAGARPGPPAAPSAPPAPPPVSGKSPKKGAKIEGSEADKAPKKTNSGDSKRQGRGSPRGPSKSGGAKGEGEC